MEELVNWLNGYIWSPVLVYIFLGIGLFYSIATRFLQLRYFKEMAILVFDSKSSTSGISSFQALALSLGSRVGVGTIAGVATAIAYGGPGAVFWMWVTSFFGACTSFVETTLAQVYKSKHDGEFRGGPPYYIEKGLKIKWFAVLFAIVTMIVSSVLLPGVQVNAVSSSMNNAFGIEPMITGIVFVVALGLVIFGGIKRIAIASEFLVPIKTIAYLIVCLIVLFANINELPGVIVLIFKSAFGMDATFGGIIGSAIAWGVKRGVYANAAGVGSETFGPAAAEVSHPAKQGLVQAFSVYIDTLILCSATAFMILVTGMYNVGEQGKELIVNNIGNVEAGAINTQMAVETVLPGFGAPFIAISLTLFAFTTLLAYYYTSETCLAFLNRNRKIKMIWPSYILRVAMVVAVFYSSVKTSALAWALGDTGLGSMAWLNIIALLLLSKPAFKVLKDYESQKKKGKDPVFNPIKIGFKDADFWEKESVEKEKTDQKDRKIISS
ncbi:alanine/glycine:cation symporter family protein [Priestia megaterium]|uniref:alanine/glycine:cation symporter family protein n=1 Tax=Priestia megaterium TaxID=1404 RepID=UPI0036DE7B31